MNVFAVAEKHMTWLSARQAITSANIANADTPGFKAKDISEFGKELELVGIRMTTSKATHFQGSNAIAQNFSSKLQGNDEATLSGNDVIMERELMRAGENSRQFSFDIGVLKSFHQMFLKSVKN